MAKKKPTQRRGRLPGEPLPGDDFGSKWANHFRELRLKKFGSQAELAQALTDAGWSVAQNTVANWELGTRSPHLHNLPWLAEALGVTICKLVSPPDWERPS